MTQPAERTTTVALSLLPSDLGGAKALPGDGEDTETAKARGSALHLLLQHLPDHPPPAWDSVAAQLVQGAPDLLAEARRLLTDPALQPLFAPGSLAEVSLTAPWGQHHLLGAIDRLVVTPDQVLAVDYKSNRTVPADASAVPDGILRQMGAYLHMLQAIFAQPVAVAILWTQTGTLMPLDPDIVRAALARATTSGTGNP